MIIIITKIIIFVWRCIRGWQGIIVMINVIDTIAINSVPFVSWIRIRIRRHFAVPIIRIELARMHFLVFTFCRHCCCWSIEKQFASLFLFSVWFTFLLAGAGAGQMMNEMFDLFFSFRTFSRNCLVMLFFYTIELPSDECSAYQSLEPQLVNNFILMDFLQYLFH